MDGRGGRQRRAAIHWVIGVVAIIALPAVSLATRTGGLAFTMFSGSGSAGVRSARLRAGALLDAGSAMRPDVSGVRVRAAAAARR
jgi:hypothetical protein